MASDVEFAVTASDRTGDALRRAEENFRRANERIRKDSEGSSEKTLQNLVRVTGSLLSPKLAGTLTKAFATASEAGGPLLGGAAIAAAPLIASTLAGAIIGGAGIGGVLGGVLLVKDDPRVQAAFDGMANRLQNRLKTAAQPFVAETISGIDQIEGALDSVDFEGILGNAAKFVDPLAGGVARFLSELGEGVADLVANADPVIRSISRGVGDLGESIGEGLSSLSDNADSAAKSLDAVFFAINGLTKISFGAINGIIELDEQMRKIGINGTAALDVLNKLSSDGTGTFTKHTKEAGESAEELTARLDAEKLAAANLGPTMDEVSASIRGVEDANRSLFDTTTSVGEALDRVSESAKTNGKTLDANTEKGRANRTALSGLVGALNSNYDAFVKVNGQGNAANGIASSNYNSFIKAARGLGIGKTAAEQYAAKLGLIPPSKKTDVYANTHDAEARLKTLKAKLDAIRSKSVTVEVKTRYPQGRDNADKLKFAAGDYWAAADMNSASNSRTGGPAAVSVTGTVDSNVTVLLDGTPFRSMVAASESRSAWRAKVGRR